MSSINSGSIVLAGAPNVKITNLDMNVANTEFSHVLENNVSVLEFKTRGEEAFQYAFNAGESDTTYISVPQCSGQAFAGIKLVGKTLYLRCSSACIMEIIEFYS
jgi:hypothetical protein